MPREIKVLKPISSERWAEFDPKSKWDCIVALRGPDLRRSQVVKFLTTSVIRYVLSGVMRTGGLINNKLPFVVIPSGWEPEGNWDSGHFFGHIYEATELLGIPRIILAPADWEKVVTEKDLNTYWDTGSIVRRLLEVVTGGPEKEYLRALVAERRDG